MDHTDRVSVSNEVTTPSERRYNIRAVERTCDILDTLAAATTPVSLSDLSAACDLPKASLFRYLTVLEARRYVDRSAPDGEYRLGVAFANFQVDHFERLANTARPILTKLRDEFGETTNLGLLVGQKVTYLDIVESGHSVRLAARRNDRDDVHCTALGKAIVAAMPEAAVTDLIGVRYERHTAHTIVGWPALKQELTRVRDQGFAVDNEENEVGGRCVAVRIPGDLDAALSVSAVSARLALSEVPPVAKRLRLAAAEVAASW